MWIDVTLPDRVQRCVRSLASAPFLTRYSAVRLSQDAFKAQQVALKADTSTITNQFAIPPNQTMTRHQERDRISAICRAHGTCRVWPTNDRGNMAIAGNRAVGNLLDGMPDVELKGGATQIHGNAKGVAFTSKICL
jgi:hypothetical protein